jgi:hypothetical protein|tara:strand:+ start:126 stop:470 length:345 start_codon:yes stop_codon:yes gene_type:complete
MQLFFFLRKNGSQGKSEQSAQFSNQQISQIHNFLESFRFYSHNRRRGKQVRAEMVFRILFGYHSNHLYAKEVNIYNPLIFLSLPSSSGIITAYHRYSDNTQISGAAIDTSSQNA